MVDIKLRMEEPDPEGATYLKPSGIDPKNDENFVPDFPGFQFQPSVYLNNFFSSSNGLYSPVIYI